VTRGPPRDPDRPIEYVADEAALTVLVDRLETVERVGVDTESNSFHAYHERVCLIQISTPEADWIVDPLAVDPLRLGPLFADTAREVVFHAAEYDVLTLKRDFGFTFGALFDTQVAAMVLGLGQVGYAALVEQFFGLKLPKGEQRSDWGRRPLTADQIGYAAADTRWLVPLRERLSEMLEARGRLAEAQAGFARLAASVPRPKHFDPEGFHRIKGYRDLDPAGRAVVRALFLAREARAEELNRPPFRILGNDVILRLAQVRPVDEKALAGIKGLPGPTLRRWGAGIVEAVRAGLADPSPPATIRPRGQGGRGRPGREPALDPDAEARFERLRIWRNARAAARGVDGQMVARNAVLKAIARENPQSPEDLARIPGLDPYALQTYGAEILAALHPASDR
jgi:ribonuclease D